MGDGPERGNTRIERLLREEAMKGGNAVSGFCYYGECLAVSIQSPYEDRLCNKSMGYRKAGILALHLYFIGLPALVLLGFRGGLTIMVRLELKSHLFRYPRIILGLNNLCFVDPRISYISYTLKLEAVRRHYAKWLDRPKPSSKMSQIFLKIQLLF